MKQKGIVIGIAVLEFFAGISAMGAADPAPRFPDRGSWGLNIHHPYSERVIDECGVQWVRVQDRWSRSEPEKGKYDFSVARKLVEFYPTDLAPLGIRCESHRTASARQLRLWYDGDDADDDKTGTPPDGGGIPETPSAPSSPSRQALGGNKHGLCVAAGQPFAGTGSVPNPHAEVAL